jgi:hypothetical protein
VSAVAERGVELRPDEDWLEWRRTALLAWMRPPRRPLTIREAVEHTGLYEDGAIGRGQALTDLLLLLSEGLVRMMRGRELRWEVVV